MKGIHRIYGIAIAFLALWTVINAKAPTVCPYPREEFPENTTTNIPHETDCTKFYKCHIGKGVKQDCPLLNPNDRKTRLHYNREKQVCDWPWEAGCHVCPPKENGRWPDAKLPDESGSCRQYYLCRNGVPISRTCPSGTCFSRTCQECVEWRAGGWCPGASWGPIDRTTPTIPTRTPSCREGERKKHECNCALFYECYNEDWIQEECRGGLHFSPTEQECVDPDEAGCEY